MSVDGVLWALSVIFYGFGDWITTVWPFEAMEELSPVTRALFGAQPGILGFGMFKIAFLTVVYFIYSVLSEAIILSIDVRIVLPLALTVFGIVATVYNLNQLHRSTAG